MVANDLPLLKFRRATEAIVLIEEGLAIVVVTYGTVVRMMRVPYRVVTIVTVDTGNIEVNVLIV